MALLAHPLDAFRSYAGSLTWQPLVRFSRSMVFGLLKRIAVGQILVIDNDGTRTICGPPQEKDGTPSTELRVLKEAFWVRVLLFADMVSGRLGRNMAPWTELSPAWDIERFTADVEVVGLCRELYAGRVFVFRPRRLFRGMAVDGHE